VKRLNKKKRSLSPSRASKKERALFSFFARKQVLDALLQRRGGKKERFFNLKNLRRKKAHTQKKASALIRNDNSTRKLSRTSSLI
jgi:hypothetical protein